MDIDTLITRLTARPDERVIVRFHHMTAGALVRRHVRATLDQARASGAEVHVRERKGLIDSVFAIRLAGTSRHLIPAVRVLGDLERG